MPQPKLSDPLTPRHLPPKPPSTQKSRSTSGGQQNYEVPQGDKRGDMSVQYIETNDNGVWVSCGLIDGFDAFWAVFFGFEQISDETWYDGLGR